MEINPRPFVIFFSLIAIFLILNPSLFFALVERSDDKAYDNLTAQLKKSPNITENLLRHPEIISALEKGNESALIVEKPVYITVTPTPDGKTYFAGEYQEGLRKIKRPFSWIRNDVSGKQDMAVHVTVYDYKIFESYHWFNPMDYLYYEQFPTSLNNKFVFVFINLYMDDIQDDDTRMWIPNENHYGLQINNTLIAPVDFMKQLRIKELEDTYNYNDDSRVGYYSAYKYYSRGSDFASTAGETYINQTWLRGGKSNAIDGYLVYEIPKDVKDEDLILSGNFFTFGNAAWKLKVDEGFY
jgi:hypothetical protein